ncbi:MAG TPA: hypothetical protein VN837_01115 [Chloroflexota bacterium]|nr:hypothetical protein [Chloroflexota bacterium]
MSSYPAPNFDTIPEAMRRMAHWVCWKSETPAGGDRRTKVPYRINGGKASSTDPSSWSGFHAVKRAYERGGYDGVGFMFSESDDLIFIDRDHCYGEDGSLSADAAALVASLGTYAERSPNDGLHLFARGTLSGDWHRKDNTEIYWTGRFSTITGNHLAGTPANPQFVNGPLDALYASLAPQPREKPGVGLPEETRGPALSDEEVIRRASACSYGPAFTALLAGDTSAYDGDESAADLALCGYLAFWCGNDATQIDRIFRGTGLLRPKWDSRRGGETYGARTIARAWSSEVYAPQPREKPGVGLPEEMEAQIQALRAELAAARMTIAAQARTLDEQRALLERIEAEGQGQEIGRLREEVALWKARYRAVIAVAECPDLSHKDKTVTALALELSGTVRAPPAFGKAPTPMEPVHVRMGELERKAGIATGGAAPSLRKAQALGFLTRVETYVDAKRPGESGPAEPRMHIAIGPGTGVIDKKLREDQRAKEAESRRLAREAKERREAADLAAETERRLAQARAAGGCLCGGELLPTGYVCADPACLVHYTPADVLALPDHAHKEHTWDTAPPRPEIPTPRKSADRSYVSIPREKPGVGPPGGYGPAEKDPF